MNIVDNVYIVYEVYLVFNIYIAQNVYIASIVLFTRQLQHRAHAAKSRQTNSKFRSTFVPTLENMEIYKKLIQNTYITCKNTHDVITKPHYKEVILIVDNKSW